MSDKCKVFKVHPLSTVQTLKNPAANLTCGVTIALDQPAPFAPNARAWFPIQNMPSMWGAYGNVVRATHIGAQIHSRPRDCKR